MWLKKSSRLISAVNKLISHSIGGVAACVLAAMMFFTGIDVALRYLFNAPISGDYELTQYMMLIVVAGALAYCNVKKGHVNVDLVTSRLPPRVQSLFYSVTSLLSLGFFVVVTRQSAAYVKHMLDTNLTSAVLLIPTFPFAALLTLGSAVFCVALLADFVNYLSQAVRK